MKITFSQMLLYVVFASMAWAYDTQAQEVLNRPISVIGERLELRDILSQIEKQAEVKFVYSTKIKSSQRLTLNVSKRKLSTVLDEILKPIAIEYEVIENRILLKKRKNEQSLLPNEEEQPAAVIQPIELPISGTIKDEKGVTMAGVSILIKGTSRGTTTDANGNFKIDVPDKNTALIISYVGYLSQQIMVGNRSQINITLLPDERSLNEVQVVAFGEQRKRDVTGSIASLKAADIRANTAASPDVALQGRAAGVQITQAGGTPGGAVRINVRGVASINSNSQPLIVIDGQPVNSSAFGTGGVAMNPLAEINPDDIESMEVLKDASASILFGSRAANGVILITTKKGAKGKPTIDFSYQQGVNTATNRVDFIDNGADHFNILKRAARNNVQAGLAPASSNLTNLVPTGILRGSLPASFDNQLIDSTTLYNTRTNWLDQVLRQGGFQQATLSAGGGAKNLTIYGSGSYRKEDGIIIGQGLRRLSGRVNVEYSPIKILKLGANVSVNSIDNEMVPLGNSYQYGLTSALPAYPIQLPDGSFFNGIANGTNNTLSIGTNPVFYRNNYSNKSNTFRNINTFFAQIEPIKGLTIRSEFGTDYQKTRNDILLNPTLYPRGIQGAERTGEGRAENRDVLNRNSNWNNTINYTRELGKNHRIGVLAGNSLQNRISDNETYITERVPPGAKTGLDTTRTILFNDEISFRFVSYFGRINYAYKDKYLFEVSLRSDGSSRFGPENRWATFPGMSVGWVISDESFLSNSSFVNFLKLRASYGRTGNAEIGNFSWQKNFTFVGYNAAIYGGIQGGQFTNPGNSALTWESTKQFDAGIEFTLWNKRISGTLDFYNKDSEGLLLDYALGPLFGTINNSMTINLGSVRNRGVEFSLTTRNITKKDFRWTTDFNISHNKNTVLSTYTAPFLNFPFQVIAGPSIATPGYPLGNYYMAQFAGFDPNTGNELFYERDRVVFNNTGQTVKTGALWDGTIANNAGNNQFILENRTPYPVLFGGLTNSFQFRKIDFNFLFYYQYGNWIYDQAQRTQSYPTTGQVLRAESPGIGSLRDELNKTEGAFRMQWNSNARGFESSRFLHDGSFIRLKNVQLGYTLPASVAKKLRLRTARISLTGQNLLTFTKFTGWDPEVFRNGGADGSTATLSPGVTNNDLPQVRTLLVGINFGF
ncbi:SusC/RagA family TonB-linked outer membrane protein [Runella salmonicolor]|uniref:TonB-dependent receptor n=1 Tax=Runella salmonicolor TaxID=2950278 RepID=A0ABT1FS98_9BACT|nr:TonB-dependent receptor [Runella salmonicolor]MCP1384634.1 TonB-dependent receptor [Runella salmonicolor]